RNVTGVQTCALPISQFLLLLTELVQLSGLLLNLLGSFRSTKRCICTLFLKLSVFITASFMIQHLTRNLFFLILISCLLYPEIIYLLLHGIHCLIQITEGFIPCERFCTSWGF